MEKYPRTYHLSFSPEIHSDDKECDMADVQRIIDEGIEVVISEKLDGGNCALRPNGVFARSHAKPTDCTSFNYIKNVHFYPHLFEIETDNLSIFGENLFAIHSIEYTDLRDYFYTFNILDLNTNIYKSYDFVSTWSIQHKMLVVPTVYSGTIESVEWLQSFMDAEIKKESKLGGDREGFVLRIANEFHKDDFSKNVFKYVRKGHVQNDIVDANGNPQHWRKNWKQAKLN